MDWIKCEFHCHTTNSDGKLSPREVLKLYKKNGYDVVAITDHDIFTKPDYIPEDLLWIPAEEFTVDIRGLPIYPPGVPKWAKFWFHVLTFYIDQTIDSIRKFKKAMAEGALAFHAHPWTTTPDELLLAAMKEIRFHGQEICNGSFGCFALMIGHIPRSIGGSDGHGTDTAPYCTVVSYVLAEKTKDDVYEALLENKVVIRCRRFLFGTNRSIAKKFEREFGKKVHIVTELESILKMPFAAPVAASTYLKRLVFQKS